MLSDPTSLRPGLPASNAAKVLPAVEGVFSEQTIDGSASA
jgi:hypothetical protein